MEHLKSGMSKLPFDSNEISVFIISLVFNKYHKDFLPPTVWSNAKQSERSSSLKGKYEGHQNIKKSVHTEAA